MDENFYFIINFNAIPIKYEYLIFVFPSIQIIVAFSSMPFHILMFYKFSFSTKQSLIIHFFFLWVSLLIFNVIIKVKSIIILRLKTVFKLLSK
jgi:hypothetical protein